MKPLLDILKDLDIQHMNLCILLIQSRQLQVTLELPHWIFQIKDCSFRIALEKATLYLAAATLSSVAGIYIYNT